MSFKYIGSSDQSVAADDATAITSIDFGKVFPSSTNILQFKIGNTGSSTASFTSTVTSVNTALSNACNVSLDGITWVAGSTGVSITLNGNEVSDAIYIKIVIPDDAYIDEATVRIATTEV